MEKNYTPLNIEALYPKKEEAKKEEPKKDFDSVGNSILLILATLTVLIISIVLFVLIQKSIKGQAHLPQLPVSRQVNG